MIHVLINLEPETHIRFDRFVERKPGAFKVKKRNRTVRGNITLGTFSNLK